MCEDPWEKRDRDRRGGAGQKAAIVQAKRIGPRAPVSSASEATSKARRKGIDDSPYVAVVDVPVLEWRRWLMLFYLSALALMSDWVCFSLSPIMHLAEQEYSGFHPSSLVTVFLGVNVFSSFFEPVIVARCGLRFGVVLGAALMCLGCWTKAGLLELLAPESYYTQLAGTILVGYAQPFFQCTPAMLTANWFGSEERTLATTVALNANQAGIAIAYVVGALCLDSTDELGAYFRFFGWVTTALTVGVVFQFRDEPSIPPTPSALAKRLAAEDAAAAAAAANAAPAAAGALGGTAAAANAADAGGVEAGGGPGPGATFTVCTIGGKDFRCCCDGSGKGKGGGGGKDGSGGKRRCDSGDSADSDDADCLGWGARADGRRSSGHRCGGAAGGVSSGGGAGRRYLRELQHLFAARGFSHTVVAFTGVSVLANVMATFLDSILHPLIPTVSTVGYVGAAFQVAFVGGSVVVSCVVDRRKAYFGAGLICFAAAAFCLFGVMLSLIGGSVALTVVFVLLLGFFAGPIEPISAETAVEVTYPVDENVLMAVQQFFGNAFSSAAVPAFNGLRSKADLSYDDSLLLLLAFLVACMMYFSTFNAPLRRLSRDKSLVDLLGPVRSSGNGGADSCCGSDSSAATATATFVDGGAASDFGGSDNGLFWLWATEAVPPCAEDEMPLLGDDDDDGIAGDDAFASGGDCGGDGGDGGRKDRRGSSSGRRSRGQSVVATTAAAGTMAAATAPVWNLDAGIFYQRDQSHTQYASI